MEPVLKALERRRRDMGLSHAALAHRAGLGIATVQRALGGRSTTTAAVEKLATALGVRVVVQPQGGAAELRFAQAQKKAKRIVALVQGTSALEGQGLTPETLREMEQRTINELLAGPNRELWAD